MTTAMAQVERGSNRIYGIRRDRPALHKYGRAAVFTALLAGPDGLGFLALAIAVLFDHAPRRRQPALSWLALGSGITVLGSMVAVAGLAAYVNVSGSFSSTYGPLAGVFALLVWSLLSSISLFFGVAVCAQLEALRAGESDPAYDDPGRPHRRVVDDQVA